MTDRSMRFVRAGLVPALVAAGILLAGASAEAAAISYSLTLCEDLSVLQNPNNEIVAQNAALKSQFVLMSERTMPYVELKNTSANGNLITQFSMSIGDTSKNFDWGSLIQASPGVTFSLASPDAIAGGVKSDVVTINFTGFVPGDFVRFRVGLSPDSPAGNPVMDYRNILFHMNGSDASHNSIVNMKFSTPSGSTTLTKQLPNFPNSNQFTSTNLDLLTTSCGMDSVIPFTVTDQGSSNPQPVPEPGSFVLLAVGLSAMAAWRWRGRRRPAA